MSLYSVFFYIKLRFEERFSVNMSKAEKNLNCCWQKQKKGENYVISQEIAKPATQSTRGLYFTLQSGEICIWQFRLGLIRMLNVKCGFIGRFYF